MDANLSTVYKFSSQGQKLLADRENGRVQRFDLEGKFPGQWKYGGQLYNVAFNAAGGMYVSTRPKGVSLDPMAHASM